MSILSRSCLAKTWPRALTSTLALQSRQFQRGENNKALSIDEIELYFLGTCSGQPNDSRSQSALGLRMSGQSWLFDCGEGTQSRMRHSELSPSEIRRIFVSHLHGDHIFGLPGMLCLIASQMAEEHLTPFTKDEPLVIVGPPGIRSFIRAATINSYSGLTGLHLQVHELQGLKALRRARKTVQVDTPHRMEVPGQLILQEEDGSWIVPSSPTDPPVQVQAVELEHTVPTVGWVLTEIPRTGRLNPVKVKPLLKKHNLSPKVLKGLKEGIDIKLPNGEFIRAADHVGPSTQRKLAILSDTRNASQLDCVRDATLLVHEATNAYLRMDSERGVTKNEVEKTTRQHGHSTPDMAGRYARFMGAKNLVLTHFSSRYPGDTSNYSRATMNEIRSLAKDEFPGDVICANDQMKITVHPEGNLEVSDNHDDRRRPLR